MIYGAFISGIELLTSAGWWGLLGLLVPIIIHLLSKKEKNIIQFGSLRFLQAIESDSAKSFQLSQYLLLLSRLVLIGLVCLLLLGPFIKEDAATQSIWVEESIYNNSDYQQLWSDLPEEQEIHLYSHAHSDSVGVHYFKSTWTLIDHLNDSADSSVVYSHSLQRNFIGQPVSLHPKAEWNIVPYKNGEGGQPFPKTVSADQEHISINEIESDAPSSNQVLKLEWIANGYDKEIAQLKKVIELSKDNLNYVVEWITSNDENSENWKIIIGETQNQNYKRTIHWMPSDRQLEIEVINKNAINIIGRIDRENIIDSNLPVRMAAMFNNDMTDIYEYDIRVLNPNNFVYPRLVTNSPIPNNQIHPSLVTNSAITGNTALTTSKKPLHSYVLLLIIPVFLLERFLNYKSVEN